MMTRERARRILALLIGEFLLSVVFGVVVYVWNVGQIHSPLWQALYPLLMGPLFAVLLSGVLVVAVYPAYLGLALSLRWLRQTGRAALAPATAGAAAAGPSSPVAAAGATVALTDADQEAIAIKPGLRQRPSGLAEKVAGAH